MLEKAIETNNKKYWLWILFLLGMIGIAFINYMRQYKLGLGTTGLSRDVPMALYIGQLTFLVGVAASAVMLVIPYYLHDFKKFSKIVILGEFLAIPAVIMCLLFVVVDIGQPMRVMNLFLHPTPNSILFYDATVLFGYLVLNVVIGWVSLSADKKGTAPPKWLRPLIFLSIPWAISIHTVTAFLYAGIPGKHYWLTAVMAARFLSSAFAAGPAFLIILICIVKRYSRFDPGKEAVNAVAKIVTYALYANVFFLGLEIFTAFYSGIHEHSSPFTYLYITGNTASIMWCSALFTLIAMILLINPKWRQNQTLLLVACAVLFIGLWIDKGLGLVLGGFLPNSFGSFSYEYVPTLSEISIVLGIWSLGLLLITLLYKVAISVREEN